MSKERVITQVQFVRTVRFSTSGTMLDYVVAAGANKLKPTRIEESDVSLTLTDDEQFVRIKIEKSGVVHLVPMSNVSSIILEIPS